MKVTPIQAMCVQASATIRQIKRQQINKYMMYVSDESRTCETKAITVLFAWLMAKDKYFTG